MDHNAMIYLVGEFMETVDRKNLRLVSKRCMELTDSILNFNYNEHSRPTIHKNLMGNSSRVVGRLAIHEDYLCKLQNIEDTVRPRAMKIYNSIGIRVVLDSNGLWVTDSELRREKRVGLPLSHKKEVKDIRFESVRGQFSLRKEDFPKGCTFFAEACSQVDFLSIPVHDSA